MKNFFSSSSNGRIDLRITFDGTLEDKTKIIIQYHKLAAYKARHQISWVIIDEIKRIIRNGGSSSPRWSWSYWEKKKSGGKWERGFSPKSGKRITTFTEGFGLKGRRVIRYAVHPNTFMNLRQSRKYPTSKTYAMLDTGAYINSFKSVLTRSDIKKTEVNLITPKYDWYRLHEYGFDYKGTIVKRPHIRPAYENFMNKSSKGKLYVDQLAKELKDYVDSEFRKKGKI